MPPPGQPREPHGVPGTSLRNPESATDQLDPVRGFREMFVFRPFKHSEEVRAEHPKVRREQPPGERNSQTGL